MPTRVELCGIPGWLSRTHASEIVGCGGGAMTTSCGACNDDGESKRFPIVNKSWRSTQVRGVGFMVYTFWTMLITIVGRLLNISFMESPVIFMNSFWDSAISF